MSQERFNRLTLVVVENDLLKTIKYEDLIDEFVLKNIRGKVFF